MKNAKNEKDQLRQAITERFIGDSIACDIKKYLDKSFLDGKLSCIHWLRAINEDSLFKQFDPPDNRLDALNEFYLALAKHDVIPLQGYPGDYRFTLEVITGMLMTEQLDLDYDFKIVSHSLQSHIRYLVGGMIDINWSIWQPNEDLFMVHNKLGDILIEEASKLGFHIGLKHKDNRLIRLLFQDSQAYRNFNQYRADARKAFPDSFTDENKSSDTKS